MSISPLVPIAGAALGSLALKTIGKLSEGFSFADILRKGSDDGADQPAPSGEATAGLDALLTADRSLSVDDLKLATRTALQQFQDRLRQQLAAQGIDLSQPITLEASGLGGVFAGNGNAQRAQIEQIFADDPELAAQFNALAASFGLLRAAQEHQSLMQLYAIDPTLAAERESRRSDTDGGEFHLVLQGEAAEVFFE